MNPAIRTGRGPRASVRSFAPWLLALFLFLHGPAVAAEGYRNGGIVDLAQTLRRVSSGLRVLHIAAHPDDEDSALIARLSLGDGAEVTYLSLSRGEGGQNLIGGEFFEDLGVLRSAELVAARELDGGRQLFGRAVDFGFSKTAEEAFAHWPRDEMIRDIVRAIRRTRPHIVTCRFSGTPADGHGQHQVSVLATREAIDAAADPSRFRDLRELGLDPWRVQKFYTGRFDPTTPGALVVPTDLYDPWIGRSLGAVGYQGRSMHRSQDMGMIEIEASRPAVLWRELPPANPATPEAELSAGVVVEHSRLRARAAELLLRPRALNDPMILSRDIAALLDDWRREAPDEHETIRQLEHALATALGLRIEAFSDTGVLHPGGEVGVAGRAYVPGGAVISRIKWSLLPAEGLAATRSEDAAAGAPAEPAEGLESSWRLRAPQAALPALPYFLREPRNGDLYRWPGTAWAGDPFEPPLAMAVFHARFERTDFSIETPVEFRSADPAYGETREPLAIVPSISVAFDPPDVRRATGQSLVDEPVTVVVENRLDAPFSGTLVLRDMEQDDHVPVTVKVDLKGRQSRRIPLILTESILQGKKHKTFEAVWTRQAAPDVPAFQVSRIDYRHIRPVTLCRPAKLSLRRLDVEVPAGLRLGYVRGSGDTVGEVLASLGASVTFLEAEDLAKTDLSNFDAIVTGARAYEVRPDLVENNARLLNYVEQGGTLVVQYNKYEFAGLGVTPRPVSFRQPHDRVTDEQARVEILRPGHPVFLAPNPIRSGDFDGWIQERGLYFPHEWDPAYVPLLASADPGEAPAAGGMLYLRHGRGHYVYTGYAFFRQLPEGVEGATRLFVNLVSLGRAPAEDRR